MDFLYHADCSELFLQETVENEVKATWRLKGRMKTAGVALVICLNIGTDPPDILKPNNCARKECWLDPFMQSKEKMLMEIGNALQQQYEKWQAKAKYKLSLDPTSDDLRRLCVNLRKVARGDRLLFHYNGHGVPRPTENGEIWVFAKHYTHYMPVSVSDLRSWLGDPSIYILDSSGSGALIEHFVSTIDASNVSVSYSSVINEEESSLSGRKFSSTCSNDDHCFVLASCRRNEILPFNPKYPADLFTSCLTTPVLIAIRWFIIQNPLSMGEINPDIASSIPGDVTDRKTPLGELNWIFTAITDTIAWDTLSSKDFQKLFRQDLLVASIFRNFLLARRIMRSLNCDPQSYPYLPETSTHRLWQSWDLAVEAFLTNFISRRNVPLTESKSLASFFFSDHLSSFEIWLDFGGRNDRPPLHLPILLQVLLSQTHRLRALKLLKRYLSMDHNAVNRSLIVGIFPYVMKLLQSPASDIRKVLVSIWVCILEFDRSCRHELVRDKSHNYFIQYLSAYDTSQFHLCKAAFVLTEICNQYKEGQQACLQQGLHRSCSSILTQTGVMLTTPLRKWVCFCLFKLCENNADSKHLVSIEGVYTQLYPLLINENACVRASSCLALGETFGPSISHAFKNDQNFVDRFNNETFDAQTNKKAASYSGLHTKLKISQQDKIYLKKENESTHLLSSAIVEGSDLYQTELLLALQILECFTDGSPLVRKESIIAISKFILLPSHISIMKHISEFLQVTEVHMKNHGRINDLIQLDSSDMSALIEKVKCILKENNNYQLYDVYDKNGNDDQITSIAAIYVRIWFSILEMESKETHPIVLDCVLNVMQSMKSSDETDVSSSAYKQRKEQKANGNFFSVAIGDDYHHHYDYSLTTKKQQETKFPLKSFLYEWNRKLFLGSDLGYHPLGDPLSKEGAMKIQKEHREKIVSKTEETLQYLYREFDEKPDGCETKSTYHASTNTLSHDFDVIAQGKFVIDRRTAPDVSKFEQSTIIHPAQNLSISAMLFHPHHDMLVISDGPNVGVWSLESGTRIMNINNDCTHIDDYARSDGSNMNKNVINRNHDDKCDSQICQQSKTTWFEENGINCNKSIHHLNHSSVTSLSWINVTTNSLLAIGSDDGSVRIWRDIGDNKDDCYSDSSYSPSLASSFHALPDVIQSRRGPGVVMCWEQSTGMLSVAGNSSSIRLWDLGREQCVRVFHTGSSTCIGSLSSRADTKALISEPVMNPEYIDCQTWTRLLAGFGDGSIGLFDERISSNGGKISTVKAHNSWVVSTYLKRDEPIAITSCVSGGVRFWDIRTMRAFHHIDANHTKMPITSMAIHPCAPLLAMGSHAQFINVMTFNGNQVGKISHHDGFLGQRIGPVSSLAFHPMKLMLAAGATDSIISVYSAENTSNSSSSSSSSSSSLIFHDSNDNYERDNNDDLHANTNNSSKVTIEKRRQVFL